MKKRVLLTKKIPALVFAVLMLASVCLGASSCAHHDGNVKNESVGSGADSSTVSDIPDIPGGETEPVKRGEVPEIPLGDNTVVLTAAELLGLIENGDLTENGDYAVIEGEPITFARAHNEKEYDLKNALIRVAVREGEAGFVIASRTMTLNNVRIAAYGGTAVSVGSDNSNATFCNVHIGGNAYAGFELGGSGSTLDGCTVKPSSGGSIERAVSALGKDTLVINCNFEGTDTGVVDESITGVMVQNCIFTDCEVSVLAHTANTSVMNNTINGGKVGIKAVDDAAEISAVMCDIYNVIAARNTITGADESILFEKTSNCVAIMNTVDNLVVSDCINAYVINNRVRGKITLDKCDYIIADSNGYGSLKSIENTNTNGSDITDLAERSAVGVNEKLLPHINKEQFAGMSGRASFRSKYGTLNIFGYINAAVAAGETDIIIPPGAHVNEHMSFSGMDGVKIYGYGTYDDTVQSTGNSFYFKSCKNVELYGFFIGNSINPNLQGTVTAVSGTRGKETIEFVADPGYLANYCSTIDFPATNGGGGGIYKAGSLYPYSEIWYEYNSKKYSANTQVNTITLQQDGIKYGRLPSSSTPENPLAVGKIEVGDRVAFRNYKGAGGIAMSDCSDMKIEDVTVFCSSGFALSDYNSDVAAYLHRYAVTSGPAPVIDSILSSSLAKVNDANRHVTWTDSYGRLRSAFYLNTTCDATHNTNSRTGMKAVSCLLESMMDDGGNINAHRAEAVSFDASTKTLTYKTDPTGGYNVLPADFLIGDKILLYTKNGKKIGSATVTEKTRQTVQGSTVTADRYTVKLSAKITLPTDETVLVQNASASGNGFLWDNVMVRNNNSYGVRISAIGGEIKNCSFVGLAKGGISMLGPDSNFPECGYACDVRITNNLFEELSIMAAQWYDWDSLEGGSTFIPLAIFGPGGNTSVPDDCMFKNITVSGNTFASRYTYYDMIINAAVNLNISGNTFTGRKDMEQSDDQAHIIICGGNGISVDGNTFKSAAVSQVIIKDKVAQNVTGSNVG